MKKEKNKKKARCSFHTYSYQEEEKRIFEIIKNSVFKNSTDDVSLKPWGGAHRVRVQLDAAHVPARPCVGGGSGGVGHRSALCVWATIIVV